MKTKLFITVMCVAVLMSGGRSRAADVDSPRKKELDNALVALLKQPVEASDPDEPSSENPGWYRPANRQTLRDFIARNPNTEEAYQAEVWLIFAQGSTELSRDRSERKIQRANRAERLKTIIGKTTQPATAKIANLQRAVELIQAEEANGFQNQADEILAHIEQYESEKDEQFLLYTKLERTSPAEIDPWLRCMLVVNACHAHDLKKALVLAQELKRKFPEWCNRENFVGKIDMLERGRSPYPTWDDMKSVGQSSVGLGRRP